MVRVGLLWRPGVGSCPNLPQRRSGPGSAAEETAEYQRFSSGVPARSGPLWQIWTTGAAAGPVVRVSPASARSTTSAPARAPARRAGADRAGAPFDRAGPARAPLGPAQAPRSARSPLNPRERTSSRRSRGLPDDLGGQVTISRVTRRSLGPPRRSPAAPHHRPLNNLPDPGLCGRFGQSAGADWLFMHQDMGDGSAGPGSDTRGRLFGRRLSTLFLTGRGPGAGSGPGSTTTTISEGPRRIVYCVPFPLLRPFTLYCTRKRGAVEGGGA